MKLSFLFITAAFAEEKKQPSPLNHPSKRMLAINEQVTWLVDNHLNCESGALTPLRIKTNMHGILERMEKMFNQCSKRSGTEEEGPGEWVPDRKRRQADPEDDRMIQTSPIEAIQQLGKGVLKKWARDYIERYPCNWTTEESDKHLYRFAGKFSRWANVKMMKKLEDCTV